MENNDKTKWINTVLNQLGKTQAPQATAALENCGRECLKSSGVIKEIRKLRDKVPNTNNTDQLFDTYKEKMYENNPRLSKKGGDIYLEYHTCACGMVLDGGVADPFLCNCTVGYTKQIFETLFDKPVEVTLMKSLLKGDDMCRQKISLVDG